MQKRSYVSEVPDGVGFEALKGFYSSAPSHESAMGSRHKTLPKCFYANEIGIKAVAGKCNASLEFLLGECLRSPERSVRYVTAGFLGDLPKNHSFLRVAYKKIGGAMKKEKNKWVKEQLQVSLQRIEKRIMQSAFSL